MKIVMTVPKFGDDMHYVGKPVKDGNGNRIGSIVEVNQVGDCYELVTELSNVYTGPDIVSIIQERMMNKNVKKD